MLIYIVQCDGEDCSARIETRGGTLALRREQAKQNWKFESSKRNDKGNRHRSRDLCPACRNKRES